MAGQPALGFGGLLRQLRADAGLTQEDLAAAASLSPRSISDLERGISTTPRTQTARLLAAALGLSGPERVVFEAAARGLVPAERAPAAGSSPPGGFAANATRTLPRDVGAFTGRAAELRQLAALADNPSGAGVVGICAIGGMAGIGKTALAVHAAQLLAGQFPDGQIFMPLHGHTRGQRPVDPADALETLLLTTGVPARKVPAGLDARAARWRDHLAGKQVLLLLDDAAGHDQVMPLLPGTAGSLVLITSRRRLAALHGADVISLDALPPGEAAVLLARLAGRPDEAAGDPGMAEITRLCGYLPLAIGMLACQLRHHPAWTAQSLAAELAAARDRLELMRAENLSVAAAFNLSYRDLTAGQRRLFRRLGLHPGPDFDVYAAASLAGTGLAAARRNLEALYGQHLITEPAAGRHRLHDLLRDHARALAAAEDATACDAATRRLLDYYLHTALTANGKLRPTLMITIGSLPAAGQVTCAPPISTPEQAAAWFETERANLDAVAVHAAAARSRHATLIPAAMTDFLYLRGYWNHARALQRTALAAACQAGDREAQARALALLGCLQGVTSDFAAAATTLQQALALYRDLGDRAGQGYVLNCTGYLHAVAGDYPARIACHQQALALFREVDHPAGQARALNSLAITHWLTGNYPAAAVNARQALDLFRAIGHQSGQANALSTLAAVHKLTGDYPAAAAALEQAFEQFGNLGDRYMQAFVRNEIGIVQRLTGNYPAAAASNQQALEEFSDLGEPAGQAAALTELGLLQRLTGDYPAAAASLQQALNLCRDLGARDGLAEVLNSLGELAHQTGASQQARDHHIQALVLARDLGTPLEEARALEGLGRSHLQDGHARDGEACLQQALTIYQRIAAPAARRIQDPFAIGRKQADH